MADKGSILGAGLAAAENTAEKIFHPAERTRDQEWRQRALVEAEVTAKREVGANFEEVKQREDEG